MKLTPREQEIVDIICEDAAPQRVIAQRLGVSAETVKRHLGNIFDKTGYSTMLELAVFTLHKRYGRKWEDLCG